MLRKILPALSAALVYAYAYADTGVFNVNFQTPSGNIICGGDTAHSKRETAWHGVSCFIQDAGNAKPARPKPKTCEFDWGNVFNADSKGKAYMSCYSDYPYSPNPSVLAYGSSIKGRGWQCVSLENGIRCTNSAGHGFQLNRNRQLMF